MTIYETIKDDYLVYSDKSYRKIVQGIIDYNISNNRSIIKVLEFGGGSGAFTRFFLEHENCIVDMIDISDNLLSIAGKILEKKGYKNRFRLINATICRELLEKLNLKQYDIIFAGAFLHHLNKLELRQSLSYLNENLSKGQIFAAFEPNLINPAIYFQYIYETKFNQSHYDRNEFPLNPYCLIKILKNYKSNKIIFYDVKYRSVSNIDKRKMILRYGFLGKTVYFIVSRIFSYMYSFLKTSKFKCKYKKDYFLLITKF